MKQSPERERGVPLFPRASEEMDRYATLTAGKGIRRTTLHFSNVNGGPVAQPR
jgi:hypothetical protein